MEGEGQLLALEIAFVWSMPGRSLTCVSPVAYVSRGAWRGERASGGQMRAFEMPGGRDSTELLLILKMKGSNRWLV